MHIRIVWGVDHSVYIGGWVYGWAMHRDANTRDRLRKRVSKLEDEVRARIEVENSANEWIAELTKKTPQGAMLEVRKRAEENSGLRPKLTPRDLESEG